MYCAVVWQLLELEIFRADLVLRSCDPSKAHVAVPISVGRDGLKNGEVVVDVCLFAVSRVVPLPEVVVKTV
jgi:hypothetical protein